MDFFAKLLRAQQQNQSWIGLRLDMHTTRLPLPLAHIDDPLLPFGKAIIDATRDLVCAYLIDLADYFAEGAVGMIALERLVRYVPDAIPIVLDCKFGELEESAEGYARGAFEAYRADAVTFNRMPDRSTLEIFLKTGGKCLFVPVNTLIMAQQSLAGCGLLIHAAELMHLQLSAIQLPALLRDWSIDDRRTSKLIGRGNFNPIVDAGPGVIYTSQRDDFAEALRASIDTARQNINTFRPTALAAL
jgi:orotidine-5'-phosphate decarboxylase